MLPLTNKTVLITGASSGLGLSLAKRLTESGACVCGVSRTKRNWRSAKNTIHEAKRFFLFQADVTSEQATRRLIQKVIKKTGSIDILINNAGYSGRPTRIDAVSLKEFQKHLSSNLNSVFLTCKYLIPIFLKQHKGLIINISSMAGKRAVPYLGAYSAAKFGVLALSQAIAKENPEGKFKCITVCPGGMNTGMRTKLFGRKDANRQQSPDFVAEIITKVILGKISVQSGGDIVIRHGRITAVNPPPAP